MNEKWFLISKILEHAEARGYSRNLEQMCILFGICRSIGVNTRIKTGLIRVISITYLGFAFLLFAGNYAIYVISKNWLQVVLMARYL
jgi:hypothetical protein